MKSMLWEDGLIESLNIILPLNLGKIILWSISMKHPPTTCGTYTFMIPYVVKE